MVRPMNKTLPITIPTMELLVNCVAPPSDGATNSAPVVPLPVTTREVDVDMVAVEDAVMDADNDALAVVDSVVLSDGDGQ